MIFKHLKKLNEFCDEIKTELGYIDYDKYGVFPFIIFEDGYIEFGADRKTHNSMNVSSNSNEIIRGRIFLKDKVISFWDLENYQKDYKELFTNIQKQLSKWENNINFFDGKWRVDLPIDSDKKDLFKEKGYFVYELKNYWLALIPITDFVNGEYKKFIISDEEIMKSHTNNKLRYELKKKGFGKGFGSDKYTDSQKYMKFLLKQESADSLIFNNQRVYYEDELAFPFAYNKKKDAIFFGSEKKDHGSLDRVDDPYGRIWLKHKIISFWSLKSDNFTNLLKDIQNSFNTNTNNITYYDNTTNSRKDIKNLKQYPIDFFDGTWYIDVHDRMSDADDFLKNVSIEKYKNYKSYKLDFFRSGNGYVIPILDFLKINGENIEIKLNADEYAIHLLNWKEKQELKKKGWGRGWGSDMTSWDSKNPLQWRQAKYQENLNYNLFENFKIDKKLQNQFISELGGDYKRANEELNWFYNILKNLNEGGYIYRIIFLPNLKFLNKENLGTHWTHDKIKAIDLIKNLKEMINVEVGYEIDDYEPYLLTCKTMPDNIDFKSSLNSFVNNYTEEEINLLNNKKIEIESIEKMKYLKKFETCDSIKIQKYDEIWEIDYNDSKTFPFIIINDEIYSGDEKDTHSDVYYSINKDKYEENADVEGRVYMKYQIISFWNLDELKNFEKIFDLVNKKFDINLYDGVWKIDVNIGKASSKTEINKLKQQYNNYFVYKGYDTKDDYYFYYALIPIKDFLSQKWNIGNDLDQKAIHLLNWKEKQELKKKGWGRGWGSDMISWDSKNPLKWRQAKYQENKKY